MCGGGAPKGPSAAELKAQEEAAAARAKAEAEKIEAERKAKQDEANAKALADSVATAQQDLERRQRQRTLLGGIEPEEGQSVLDGEDELDAPVKKKKSRTLVGE